MPTYISLINFTQKGAEAIRTGPSASLRQSNASAPLVPN